MKFKRLDKFFGRMSSNADLSGKFVIGAILLSTLTSLFVFYPISIYTNPYVLNNPTPNINTDNLRLKRIFGVQVVETPKLGFNRLAVSWPVWSDCGPVYVELIQYNNFRKEIYIWI
ncbi:MAG: hypothetical protein ACXABG_10045, partial [Promethearchaeota archaeon]